MSWNSNYVTLLHFIETHDKNFLLLFNTPSSYDVYIDSTIQYVIDLIKELYRRKLSLSWDEYRTLINSVDIECNDRTRIDCGNVRYVEIYVMFKLKNTEYHTAKILIKELELKIAYSRVKQKYNNK